MAKPLPPLRSAAYLLVLREQNSRILDEFSHSFRSLRRFHPDLPVMVYHENLSREQLGFVAELPNVMPFPIALDRGGRFPANHYLQRHGWTFPELYVHAAKLDVLLMTPGDTLWLDTDTEVRTGLEGVFASGVPHLDKCEGLFREHERDLSGMLSSLDFEAFGWRGDLDRLAMFNAGVAFVPQHYKVALYKAKELLWALSMLRPEDRGGDNRLDEQIAMSIALQEATDYRVGQMHPRIYHYWLEKYEAPESPWYRQVFRTVDREGGPVLVPPGVPEVERANPDRGTVSV